MTACTNHGGKARRVVTAALVGVLSVGTVPMVALAEGVSDSVSPMFAEPGTEFSEGTAKPWFLTDKDGDGRFGEEATSNEDHSGNEWLNRYDSTVSMNEDGVWEVSAEDMPFVVSADYIDIAGTNSHTEINAENVHDYKIRVYRADEKGEPTGGALVGNKVTDAGEYVMTVTALAGTPYENQTFKTNFVVKGVALPKVKAFENGIKTDIYFKYTGSELDVDFKEDGGDWTILQEGVDYTVTYTKNNKPVDSVTEAGTYVATLKGMGKYAGSTTDCTIEVEKFKIDATSNTELLIAPFDEAAPKSPYKVTFTDPTTHDVTDLDPTLVTLNPVGSTSSLGSHDFTVSTDDPNIELGAKVADKTHTWSTKRVERLATFNYHGSALSDSYELDASKGEEFDTTDIKAFVGKTEIKDDSVKVDVGYDKKVTDGSVSYGTDAETDLNDGVPGVYDVTVSISDSDGNEYAGAAAFTVTVYKGELDVDSSVYVYSPDAPTDAPVAITSYEKSYDGAELTAGSFAVTGKGLDADDFIKQIVDAEGNPVDSAVDAGSYKLVVTSDWYKLSGTTELPITINKVDLTSLEIGKLEKWNDVAGQEYLPLVDKYIDTNHDGTNDTWVTLTYPVNYVDSAITNLGLVYATGNDGLLYSDKDFSALTNGHDFKGQDFVPGNVEVTVEYNDEGTWKEIGDIDREGSYRLTVSVADEVAANYVLPEGETSVTLDFTVARRSAFSDVQPSDWYYAAVNQAYRNSYMSGYAGTSTFGAEDNLTRAQAVIVLFNMSGGYFNETGSNYNEVLDWVTGFDDVDGHAYYAQAVAWAKKTGVVNGYDEDTFGPEDEITREQFAAMLANYAKVVNRDETVGKVDESVLADFADANTVSDWAKGAVAWAASATEDRDAVMGNNGSLMGQNKITRGEVAAMVTNYQPDAKAAV